MQPAASRSRYEARLVAAAERGIQLLTELVGRLDHGEVQHLQHVEMAERARAMGEHLRAALALTMSDAYPSAFGLLRIALEHQLVDELIFRGRHHRQVYWNVSADLWAEWQAERNAGADWAEDIVDWSRTEKRGGTVTIRRRGLPSEPDEHGHRIMLSIYYFLIHEYSPLQPPPGDAELPTQDSPLEANTAVKWAERSRDLYRWYLSWSAIRSSLVGEDFFTEEELGQLDVHYRFLSAYVHPISNRTHETYGLNADWPTRNAATSVLCLLYVATFAARELRDYLLMSRLDPPVMIKDEEQLVADLATLDRLAGPLWFPGQSPHQYDYNQTAQRDRLEAMRRGEPDPPARPSPLYYGDPLRRIIGLKSDWQH